MIRQWIDKVRLATAQYRVERFTLSFPRFRTTLLLLWGLGIFALAYGHFFKPVAQGQTVSIILSIVSWVTAVAIIALRNPAERLRLLGWQILSLILLLAFLVAGYISYSFVLPQAAIVPSIKYAWVGSTLLIGVLTWRSVMAFFNRLSQVSEKTYPGLTTAPLLFILLLVNLIWWWIIN